MFCIAQLYNTAGTAQATQPLHKLLVAVFCCLGLGEVLLGELHTLLHKLARMAY